MRKRKPYETRFITLDVVAIPITRIPRKSEAYRNATQDGWGTVWVDKYDTLSCGDDCSATLISKYDEFYYLLPGDKLDRKRCFKQADCKVIIMGDEGSFSFWEETPGLVKLFVTLDNNGFIDNYRVSDWTDEPNDNEMVIEFNKLPTTDIYE